MVKRERETQRERSRGNICRNKRETMASGRTKKRSLMKNDRKTLWKIKPKKKPKKQKTNEKIAQKKKCVYSNVKNKTKNKKKKKKKKKLTKCRLCIIVMFLCAFSLFFLNQ